MLPPADRGGLGWALGAWMVILVVAGVIIIGHSADRPAPPGSAAVVAESERISPPGMISALARAAVAASKPSERRDALALASAMSSTPMDEARVAVARAEIEGRAKGLAAMDRVLEGVPSGSAVHADILLLRRLVDGQQPASLDIPEEFERVRARQGFFLDLATVVARPDTDPKRRAVMGEAQRTLSRLEIGTLAIIGLVIASGVMFVLACVKLARGPVYRAFMPPGPGGSVYLETFAVFLVGFVAYAALLGRFGEHLPAPVPTILQWLLLGCVLWPLVRGVRAAEARVALGLHTGRGVLREMGAGVAGYLACLPLVIAALGVTLLLRWLAGGGADGGAAPLPVHPLGDRIATGTGGQVALLVILATLWAPIVEETFFRGALYRHLRARWNVAISALVVGVIFAAIHPQGWLAIPPLTALAVVFALLREWRGSLIAPMTAHALNNGVIVGVMVLITGG